MFIKLKSLKKLKQTFKAFYKKAFKNQTFFLLLQTEEPYIYDRKVDCFAVSVISCLLFGYTEKNMDYEEQIGIVKSKNLSPTIPATMVKIIFFGNV